VSHEQVGGVMRPRLVIVHGIGGLRDEASELRRCLVALAAGARQAGHSSVASELEYGHLVQASLAYYADLFVSEQAQGVNVSDLGDAEAVILADLMRAIVDAYLDRPYRGRERRIIEHARVQAAAEGQTQGVGNLVRQALNVATTLLSLGPVRRAGQWATPKLMVGDLAQVARYLARCEPDTDAITLDQRIRSRLIHVLGREPAVVVAHSLGTVVAMEALHEYPAEVPLFVTLGSPISMRTVVWPRLVPQPPSVPDGVSRWLNFWDRDDVIAVRPLMEDDLLANVAGVRVASSRIDSDGLWVHPAAKYLASPYVGGPVAEALVSMAQLTLP
jgi:hypothetical protein